MAEFLLGLAFLALIVFAEECFQPTKKTQATWD